MESKEQKALWEFAKSWNNLDVRYLENILSDDFTYRSQWSMIPITGKKAFIEYLKSKFKAIQEDLNKEIVSVTAEIALCNNLESTPCIVLTQETTSEVRKVTLLVKMDDSRIRCVEVCSIPDPNKAIRTGDFPR